MSEKEKLILIEEALDVDEGSLAPDMLLDDIEEYDSMAKLSLIVMVEDECGIKLDSATVKSFVTVKDILDKMEK